MVTTASTEAHQIGDEVSILWGLDSITGRLLDIYRTGFGLRYVVAVPVLGPDGEALDHTTVTVPAEALL